MRTPPSISTRESHYFFRLYFSTHQHVYALPYQRQIDKLDGEPPLPAGQTIEFVRPLTELAFTGATWLSIFDRAVDDVVQPLLYIPQRYDPYSLGRMEAVLPHKSRLPVKNTILVRPSHTTPEVAAYVKSEGWSWFISAVHRMQIEQEPFPLPSLEPQRDDAGQLLYDVFRTPAQWAKYGQPLLRLSFEQAREAAQAIVSKGGLLLQYDEEQDTLEWLNASYIYYPGLITDIDDPANRQIPRAE